MNEANQRNCLKLCRTFMTFQWTQTENIQNVCLQPCIWNSIWFAGHWWNLNDNRKNYDLFDEQLNLNGELHNELVQHYLFTLRNVCAVQWKMFSIAGGYYQYREGITSVLWEISSVQWEISLQYCRGFHYYCGEYLVLWKEIKNTMEVTYSKCWKFPLTELNTLHGTDGIPAQYWRYPRTVLTVLHNNRWYPSTVLTISPTVLKTLHITAQTPPEWYCWIELEL